jgi:hypothetical protein
MEIKLPIILFQWKLNFHIRVAVYHAALVRYVHQGLSFIFPFSQISEKNCYPTGFHAVAGNAICLSRSVDD